MAKYLLLKHYRGAPAAVNDVPMGQWKPEEITAHVQYMEDFARRLEGTGEYVDAQALSPDGTFVRYDGVGRPPVTDGPFAETKDLIAGWMVIDVESRERAVELAGELSAAPGAGGRPIHSGSSCARSWARSRPSRSESPGGRDPAAGTHARGDRDPRAPRSRFRGGRGRRPGRPRRGLAGVAARPAQGPDGLARHGGVAPIPRRRPRRGRKASP
ncbi:hypothetical protein GCM10023169_22170 [Georgenia halophila]|uniref:YCII-related domain-containing protein n=1 Tax=Georgenia halophila TaxID=620889 RepID=A0ABP8L9Y7_9MICO